MAKVELKNICKVYDGGVRAVENANITIEDKEFVVLVGPSGCGKSTTLRMIAGLEEISEGELYIDGDLMNDIPPKDRNIAMVFQNYALYPHMSVYENMAFGLRIKKLPKDTIDQRVKDAAKTLELDKLLDRKPKALSGGQRQRVAVGRAIVRNPKVFLFDEPLSNLDAKLRVQMRAELSGLHLRLNATMIYVTHDQVEAMTMASKIVVMKDGWVQQIGSPLYLYNHPQNKFVAGFIGSPPMNFLSVLVKEEGGQLFLDEGTFKIKPDSSHADYLKKYVDTKVDFGIRPEDMKYVESEEDNSFSAQITVVEPLGADIHLWLTTGTQHMVARTGPHHEFKVGEKANFVPQMEKARYFIKKDDPKDPENELAILPGPGR
jgi:multiple sugar transport system ATP-binding protein